MSLHMWRRHVPALVVTTALAGLGLATISSDGSRADSTPTPDGPKLHAPRSGHDAALLNDGQVLLSGGSGPDGPLSDAELFDPGTRLFSPAPQGLRFPRHDHRTVALPGGSLLTVGGDGGQGPLDMAEVAAATGEVAAWFSTQEGRSGHTATLLLDGRVLILGGRAASGAFLRDAEIFEPNLAEDRPYVPESGAFKRSVTALAIARADHTATLFPDGRILIAGGRNEAGELATAEILDPATGETRALQATLAMPRADHTATLRPDGNVTILGGYGREGAALRDAEIFVVQEGRFGPARGLREARAGHTATLLPTGQILVAGGETDAGFVASAELLSAIPVKTRPQVAAALPADGAQDVPLNQLIGVRFSRPMDVRTIRDETLVLSGPRGTVPAVASPADAGLYAFLVPQQELEPATWYQVAAVGVTDAAGNRAKPIVWRFRTGDRKAPAATSVQGIPSVHACIGGVGAGPDRNGVLPVRTRLRGLVSQGATSFLWTKSSGPGAVTFSNPTDMATDMVVATPGTYVLRLTVMFGDCPEVSDEMQYTVGVRGDMNGDNRPDLMWQERAGLNGRVWAMGGANGLTRTAEVTPTPATTPGVNQKIVAIGDFDDDGKSDWLVQRNAAGKIFVYYMDYDSAGNIFAKPPGSPVFVSDTPNGDQNWMVVGAPDLNHDGKPDLLLQHQLDGTFQVWYMDGITVTSTGTMNGLLANGPNPKIVSVDDFNGDGNADLLYQRPFTGKMFVAYLNGVDFVSQVFLTPAFASTDPNDQVNWRVVGSGDYNGDGKPDLLFKHELTGVLKAWLMNGATRDQELSPAPDRFDPANPTASVEWWVYGNFAWYRGRLNAPVITPAAGTFTGPITVTVTAWTGSTVPWTGATLRYTTNGADPDLTSPAYTGPLFVDQTLASLKAQASMFGWVPSAFAAGGPYTFTVANPAFSLASGAYPWGTRITVTCATPGALIHYTTNGNEPTELDPTVSSGSAVVLDRAFTLKAKAWKPGSQASATTTATYTLSDQNVRSVLMIVGDVSEQGETSVRDHLLSRGYTVIMKADQDVVRQDAALASVVLFSSSCNSNNSDLAAFWDVTTSIVSFESQLWDDFKMATPRAGAVTPTQVTITAPDHVLAAHKQGTVAVYSAPVSNVIGDPGSAAVKVASFDPGGADPAVFAYERGAALLAGQWAMGRRVGIFDPRANMTGDGWDLFDAAIDWSVSRREARAIFVQGADVNTGTVSPYDLIAINRLNQLGFAVYIKDANATASDASGMAFVAISSSLGDGTDATTRRFRSVEVPVVIWKAMHFDDLFGALTRGTMENQANLDVVLPGHPLAGGLPAASVQVTSYVKRFGWAQPGPEAVRIAQLPGINPPKYSVFGFEYGAPIPAGTAPERRVGLFMDDPSAFSSLTASGWKLFDAAVSWASESDSDHDGLTSAQESAWHTDPRNPDFNDDGILDGAAVAAGLSPTNPDMDGDGVDNLVERQRGTDPFRWDTDGDGCSDNSTIPGGDWFPLDPTRCQVTDTPGVPSITLVEPTNATFVSATCSPSPCP